MNKDNKREEYIRVLDFLPRGHPEDDRPSYKKEKLIQGIGEDYFMLLETVPKDDEAANQYDRLYIGSGERDIVDHVKRRIGFKDLTHGSQVELPFVVEEIIEENEEEYLSFFNEAQPITTRQHALELLPGIGKKLMWKILEEREEKEFESFEELAERIDGINDPARILAKRIEKEIKEEDVKYHLFVKD